MTNDEILGITAFAKAVNSSWVKDKVFVSVRDKEVLVTGDLELVLNFVTSVTNLFCGVCASIDFISDDALTYSLF